MKPASYLGRGLQNFLLWSYSRTIGSKVLSQPFLERPFIAFYFLYKRYLEDPFARLLQDHPTLLHHGSVLDIGANVGYTTTLFAQFVDTKSRVYAFEPEKTNARILSHVV